MKVNKSKEHATVSIRNLFVGQTFTAPRKGYGDILKLVVKLDTI